jgi:hypothetical protein
MIAPEIVADRCNLLSLWPIPNPGAACSNHAGGTEIPMAWQAIFLARLAAVLEFVTVRTV